MRPGVRTSAFAVRLAAAGDAACLAAWLQAVKPLNVPDQRAREAAIVDLLARPERGACLIAQQGATAAAPIVGLLPAMLFPSLGNAGLTAWVSEWLPAESGTGQGLADCLQALAGWCMAHGVRHLQLAPGVHAALLRADASLAGAWRQGDDGLWQRALNPSPKQLR